MRWDRTETTMEAERQSQREETVVENRARRARSLGWWFMKCDAKELEEEQADDRTEENVKC